jgi:hypothetical protein
MKCDPKGLINPHKPIDKRLVAFNCEDLEKLRTIFPENGMQTYLPGLLTKLTLKQLSLKEINTFYDRISGGHYDWRDLIKDYEIIKKECS